MTVEAKKIRVACDRYSVGEDLRLSIDLFRSHFAPDAQRIECRRDAAGRQQAVVGDHGRDWIPIHLGPGHVMCLEMIGMQLDQTRKQEVAADVLGVVRRAAFADLDDAPVHGCDPSGLDHAVREDHASISQEQIVSHLHPQAAAVKR